MHRARAFFFVCAGLFLLGSSSVAGPSPWPANYLLGLISSNKTLTRAYPGPFYYMVGDLTVAPGATLTIEPGCTISVSASDTLQGGQDAVHVEFAVNGALVCQGDAADSICFRSASPGVGNWLGISVGPSGSASLAYCSITGAVTAVTVGNGGAGNLSNSEISACVGGVSGPLAIQRCILLGPGAVGRNYGASGGVSISDPTPNDPNPTVIRWFFIGVSSQYFPGQVANVLVTDCSIGFDFCVASYCTAYNNNVGFYAGTAKNCISAANSSYGFEDSDVSFSDSWSNPSNYAYCTNLPMTANWSPFFMNAPSDLRLRPESIFMTWSDTGMQIGAYGPGAGPPVAARRTSWGSIKSLYR